MENAAFAGELQWDVTQRHERCHNTGNDLMTSNVMPLPSEQSFLCLQLNVLHYHTVHFLFNLLSLSTFLSQQTLLDDLWKNLQINSWFNFITNVFVCVQRLFMDQHCVQVVNLKKGEKMILFLCAQDHIFSFFFPLVLKDAWRMMFLYKYRIEV